MTTKRRGREKLHFLNPVPIRLVHDRWVSKYAEPWAAALTGLKHTTGGQDDGEGVRDLHQDDARSGSGRRSPTPRCGRTTASASSVDSDWTPGSRYKGGHCRRAGIDITEGENLEVDPPRRLVQSFNALWSDDVKAEGTSRVTWEIEPVGELLPADRDPRPAARGRQRRALRRLADDPLRAQDPARDRRAPHDARLAALCGCGQLGPDQDGRGAARGGASRLGLSASPSPAGRAARSRCCGRCGSGGSSRRPGWRGRSATLSRSTPHAL